MDGGLEAGGGRFTIQEERKKLLGERVTVIVMCTLLEVTKLSLLKKVNFTECIKVYLQCTCDFKN